ncbi:hypothetical protein [Kitasatospora paracochleata]|uniref:Uncharacterized protein n=1 Tax=Kitasatospora paracochleata TaxID=58354 RepID=A0ABT1J8K6_9ACTN|nr:hypothetical protein [Kitasatospora paracochleata]MCP2313770.1 hypothetical protein [Kitasatospora paracochleata]
MHEPRGVVVGGGTMGRLAAAARAVGVVVATWLLLTGLFLLPVPLIPESWGPVVHSPATVGLWLLSLPVAPVLGCFALRRWIARPVTPQVLTAGKYRARGLG